MVDLSIDSSGIIEICKSAPMRSALQEQADKIRASASSEADSLIPALESATHRNLSNMRNPNYYSGVNELRYTCVGAVWAGNTLGVLAENANKTLGRWG